MAALIRNGVAYAIGLALVLVPLLYYGTHVLPAAPTREYRELEAGYFFTESANRALAVAIVARNAAKVGSIAPAANLHAVGSKSFMRLALEDGRADPGVVAALLRTGLDPDQDSQLLFGWLTESAGDTGLVIKEKNEPLLRAVIDAGIDLNHENLEGRPRFLLRIEVARRPCPDAVAWRQYGD